MARRDDSTTNSQDQPQGDLEREAWLADQIADLQERTAALSLQNEALQNEALRERDTFDKACGYSERVINGLLSRAREAEADSEPPTFEGIRLEVTQTAPAPLPAILERPDGNPIIYANRFSTVHGEPSTGKSWVALAASAAAIRKGGRVLWWDFEERPETLAKRAAPFGYVKEVTNPDCLFFTRSERLGASAALQGEALAWMLAAADPTYSLVVIDSATSAGCPSDGEGDKVTEWLNRFIDPWRRADVAVVLLDHVPKRRADRPPGPLGSQNKRAWVDGASLRAIGRCWTKSRAGYITLINEKDRPGDMPEPIGKAVATIRGNYDKDGGFGWEITEPGAQAGNGTDRDAEDRQTVLEAIATAGEQGVVGIRALQSLCQIRRQAIKDVCEDLEAEGLIQIGRGGTRGQAQVFVITMEGLHGLASDDSD